MKIAINAQLLTNGKEGGVSRYVHNMCKSLLQEDPFNEYVLVSPQKIQMSRGLERSRCLVGKVPPLPSGLSTLCFSRFRFTQLFLQHRCDLAFVPWVVPFGKIPAVVMVHDLVPLCRINQEVDAYHHRLPSRVNFSLFARHYAHRARLILVNSEDTKRSVVEQCKVLESQVKVIPLGVDALHFYPRGQDERVLLKYALERPYLINVASCWQPRKNLVSLIRAFSSIAHRVEVDLVITGQKGPSFPRMRQEVKDRDLVGRVHFLELVPYADLPFLLSGALGLVFPSFHEGFGLPVLEAMACGCPVICAHTGALPEVAGDAALYVDPAQVESIAHAMAQIVDSSSCREALRGKGIAHVRPFTWARTAKETAAVFQTVKSI